MATDHLIQFCIHIYIKCVLLAHCCTDIHAKPCSVRLSDKNLAKSALHLVATSLLLQIIIIIFINSISIIISVVITVVFINIIITVSRFFELPSARYMLHDICLGNTLSKQQGGAARQEAMTALQR